MIINGTSYKITIGYNASSDPKEDTIKYIHMMDGSQVTVDFGARKERIADIEIVNLGKAQFVTLVEYMLVNAGNKVLIQIENDQENPFPDVSAGGGTDYYVYLLESTELQEEDFSINRQLFKVKVRFALAGVTINDIPNPEDTSNVDILVKIDTLNNATRSDTAPSTPTEGDRWLDTTTDEIFIYENSLWVLQYIIHPDDTSVGFAKGIFYLSMFSTQTLLDDNNWVSGILNNKSIQLPNQNIDISKGASIARKDGFEFSVNNSSRFWKYIIDNNISLFNVTCEVYLVISGEKQLVLTGVNKTNSFTYTDYKFKAEPFLFNFKETFPSNVIGDDPNITGERYDNIKPDMYGKAPYKTFGEHSFASLQNISTVRSDVGLNATVPTSDNSAVPAVPVQFSIFAQISAIDNLKIYIPKTYTASDLVIYSITADQITSLQTNHVVKILFDDIVSSNNVGESRKIESVDNSDSNWIIITLFETFPSAPTQNPNVSTTPPDTLNSQFIYLIGASYQFQIDDVPAGGFGSYDVNGDIIDTIILYAIDKGNNRDLVPIPSTDFSQNADGNIVSLSVETASDKTSLDTFETTSQLIPIPINKNFQGVSNVYLPNTVLNPTMNTTLGTSFTTDFERVTAGSAFTDTIPVFYSFKHANTPPGDYGWLHKYKTTILGVKASNYASTIGIPDVPEDDSLVNIFSFPVNHVNDSLFINNDKARLGMRFSIRNFMRIKRVGSPYYTVPVACNITIRFKTVGNTYIDSPTWKHPINNTNTGLTANQNSQWSVIVNNMPNGSEGGFSINPPVLEDTWTLDTSATKYIIQTYVTGSGTAPVTFPFTNGESLKGLRMWFTSTGAGAGTHSGLYEMLRNNNTYYWSRCATQPTLGEKLVLSINDVDGNITLNEVYVVDSVSPLTIALLETNPGVQTLRGRDLWDLNEGGLIGGGTPLWSSITSMELLISFKDFTTNQFIGFAGLNEQDFVNEIVITQPPTIFFFKEMELVDVPLFSQVRGELTYSKLAKDIIPQILDTSPLADKYDVASLTAIMNSVARYQVEFKRQFTSAISSDAMLSEILKNIWACAIINEEDKLVFKPLEASTGSPIATFNETNIVNDSVTEITFRDMDDIIQKFRFNYGYFIPSEFSKAIQTWEGTLIIDKNNGSQDMSSLLKQWSNIYSMKNQITYDLIYHVNTPEDDFANWVVSFFFKNAWTFRFKTSFSNVYKTSFDISPSIKLLDVISVSTYFHTNLETVNGFVVGISPDFFEGIVDIEIYVINPPGGLGVICNPFNDALDVGTRDISGWTELNGRQNNAGDVGTRNLGSFVQKDAGDVGDRNLNC